MAVKQQGCGEMSSLRRILNGKTGTHKRIMHVVITPDLCIKLIHATGERKKGNRKKGKGMKEVLAVVRAINSGLATLNISFRW